MSLKRLTMYVVVFELIALGVFFAFFLGFVVSQGGRVILDMTVFNEMWPEYVIMVVFTAIGPYALYYVFEVEK